MEWQRVVGTGHGDAGSVPSILSAVSCVSATDCTAVGYYSDHRTGSKTLAESWNGSTWSLSAVADPPARFDQLDAVSCPSASACMAVGFAETRLGTRRALAESWNGAQWSVLKAPDPSRHTWLAGVSCTSASTCIAVGTYEDISVPSKVPVKTKTLAESWNGTAWSLMVSANPRLAAYGDTLSAVACVSPAACTAVGFDRNPRARSLTLAESWNGRTWSALTTADVGGITIGNQLTAVSCGSATACLAVGSRGFGTEVKTLAESSQTGHWSVLGTPGVPALRSFSVFRSVSCSSPTDCMAVGSYGNNVQVSRTLAASWDGTSWLRTPTAGLGNDAALTGVSCVSATFCVAVGWASAGSAVAESWNGSTWSMMRTPAVSGGFSAVSCPSATTCIAVGDEVNARGDVKTLAESWDGHTWSVIRTTKNQSAIWNDLYAVSCVSATACTAVGSSFGATGGNETLAESWNGTTWSITPTPTLSSSYYILAGVSCVSATACTAVGATRNTAGTDHSLAESWNGRTWRQEHTPHIGPFDGLGAISCVSATSCTAVSSYDTKTAQVPLAESWNGKTWSQIPTQQPSNYSWFEGVSCISATDCTAVGTTSGHTLVETG